ncbi:MAG: hypothetical protein AAGA70_17215 [Pseudomonadota bacterium]
MTFYAVLTGQLEHASDLTPDGLSDVMTDLHLASEMMAGWTQGHITSFARRGGGGWQIVLNRPRLALRATLYCCAVVQRRGHAAATRIAVADGDGTLPPERDPNAGHGPVFMASIRALETMAPKTRLCHAAGGPDAAIYRLAGAICARWTAAQARAVAEMLPLPRATQAAAASRLGITRAAVQQALAGADYRALIAAIGHMEAWA